VKAQKSHQCPVCGWPSLDYPPWEGMTESWEPCASCWFIFGYHDEAVLYTDDPPDLSPGYRERAYYAWRLSWIRKGMPWSSIGESPPDGWDPIEQLTRAGLWEEPTGSRATEHRVIVFMPSPRGAVSEPPVDPVSLQEDLATILRETNTGEVEPYHQYEMGIAFYMFGPDADAILEVALPFLEKRIFPVGTKVVARHGPWSDQTVKETERILV
jgi:hypothetical protein